MARQDDDGRRRQRPIPVAWVLVGVLLLALGATIGLLVSGSDDPPASAATTTVAAVTGDTQTVSFQAPADPGPDPFTDPTDTKGDRNVQVTTQLPDGTFGGTGSNFVCDRDKLIRSLKRSDKLLRAWAKVLGLRATYSTVARYIARLHPVTLKRDTRVTNHAYLVNGRVRSFQAILQAGTAVLADEYGRPVVRCRCGNPLTKPAAAPSATCSGCPPKYKPPEEACDLWSRHSSFRSYYPRDYYENEDYDLIFIRLAGSGPYILCYAPYPAPPQVRLIRAFRAPPKAAPEPSTTTTPAPHTDDSLQCNPARSQLEFEQCRDAGLLPEQQSEPAPAPTPAPTPEEPQEGELYPPAE